MGVVINQHIQVESPLRLEHAYPSDLAALVLDRWGHARMSGQTALRPPDASSLTAALSACYQATLLREEGRPVTFRLAVIDPDAFDAAAGPPSGVHRLVFTRRLPLDAHELRRLAPAAIFSRSLIGATFTPVGGPEMWGVIHSGPQWLQPARGGRAGEQTIPQSLIISATGPGRLLVSIGTVPLAELKNGTLSDVEIDLFQSRWMQQKLSAMSAVLDAPFSAPFAAVLAGQVLRRTVASIRAALHGGTVIVVPQHRASELLTDGRHVRVKYGFADEEPRRRVATLISVIMNELTCGEHGTDVVLGWDAYELGNVGAVEDEALFEVAHLLADLTRVDGTLLITDSLEVLGFGVEIAGELPEVLQVAHALDLEGTQRDWVRTDRVGSRHRSAYRLCQALHDVLALVVSQDGGLRFIRWHDDGVTYWEQLATGPWEI